MPLSFRLGTFSVQDWLQRILQKGNKKEPRAIHNELLWTLVLVSTLL